MTWDELLETIASGKAKIPVADTGIPAFAVNAPFYELMQLMQALTSGYEENRRRCDKYEAKMNCLRKIAAGNFPASKKKEV